MIMKDRFVCENWVEIKIVLNTKYIPTVSKRVEDLSKYTTSTCILYFKYLRVLVILFQINEHTVECANYGYTWNSVTVFVQGVLIYDS